MRHVWIPEKVNSLIFLGGNWTRPYSSKREFPPLVGGVEMGHARISEKVSFQFCVGMFV